MTVTPTAWDGAGTGESGEAGPAGASPFVDFDRSAWARLGENVPLPLTGDELAQLRSVGDEVDLAEVREVYLPLSRLLTLHVQESGRLYRDTPDEEHAQSTMPSGTFSQLPWLGESQTQSSSRSSSSPRRMPVPRSRVSSMGANGSSS